MSHHLGYVATLSSAIMFGIGVTLNKIILAELHPLVAAGLIYLIAGIAIGCFTRLPYKYRKTFYSSLGLSGTENKPLASAHLKILALVILSGVIIAPFLFLFGLDNSTAVNASLLTNTEVLFTIMIAVVFFKERTKRQDYFAIILIIFGVFAVTTNLQLQNLSFSEKMFGNVLIILGCLFWGIDNNLSKLISKDNDLVKIVSIKSFMGGLFVLFITFAIGLPFNLNLTIVSYIIIVGTFSIGISIILFMYGLREIGTVKTGVIFSTSSLFGAFFAFILLRETLSIIQIAAGALMLLGVYLLCRGARPEITTPLDTNVLR